MGEISPRRFPTSLSQELGFSEENEPLNSFLFQSPAKMHSKTESPERQGHVSPSFSPNRSRKHDCLGGNDDFRELLFTFPRLYSDLTSERDPFFDCRGMPLNPHNTPISHSGRQSETGSWRNDERTALSPAKSEKRAPHLNNATTSNDSSFVSPSNRHQTAWRPPKPPKPLFLSGVDLFVKDKAENVRPSVRIKPPKRGDGRRNLSNNPYQSLPIRPGWNLTQTSPAEQIRERPKQSWQSRNIATCRYFPRPFTDQELEILGIPLNKGIPFPAPIPTMDKLPLRRGIIRFDQDGSGQCLIDTGASKTITPTAFTVEGTQNTIWRLAQQLTKTAIHYLTPWKQAISERESSVRTTVTIPFASKCEVCPLDSEQATTLDSAGGAYVLQVSLAFPLLFAQCSKMVATVIHKCLSSHIAVATACLVHSFMMMMVRWLLFVFRVEVSVEVRRI